MVVNDWPIINQASSSDIFIILNNNVFFTLCLSYSCEYYSLSNTICDLYFHIIRFSCFTYYCFDVTVHCMGVTWLLGL